MVLTGCVLLQQQSVVELWCGRTWKRNSVAGSGGPTVPACRLGGGCVKNEAAHLHTHKPACFS